MRDFIKCLAEINSQKVGTSQITEPLRVAFFFSFYLSPHLDYQVFFQKKYLESTPQARLEKELIASSHLYMPLLYLVPFCLLFVYMSVFLLYYVTF